MQPPPMDAELARIAELAEATRPSTKDQTVDEMRARVKAGDAEVQPGPRNVDVSDGVVDTSHGRVAVRSYRPWVQSARTLVYAHGGGWVTGDLDYSDALCRHLATRTRSEVISVDYRRAPENVHPGALNDVYAVLERVSHGRLIGVAGDSAGALLAALCAVRAAREGLPLALQALIYPALDPDPVRASHSAMANAFPLTRTAMEWFWQQYAPEESRAALSPFRSDLAGVAPAYIATAGHDPLHDEAADYANALREAGVTVVTDDFGTLCHGFLRFTASVTAARDAQERICVAVNTLFTTRG